MATAPEEQGVSRLDSREDAVRYLESLGIQAAVCDWVLGKTVQVYFGGRVDMGGIQGWKKSLCIYPQGSRWAIVRFDVPGNAPHAEYGSLEDAIHATVKLVAS